MRLFIAAFIPTLTIVSVFGAISCLSPKTIADIAVLSTKDVECAMQHQGEAPLTIVTMCGMPTDFVRIIADLLAGKPVPTGIARHVPRDASENG